MSTVLGDYNRLLVIAIWVFFASGFLMLKPPGQGVAYLVPGRTRVRFPSWRAAFGRRLALFVSPMHAFWPMAEVDLLARSRPDAMEALIGSARQLAQPMRFARPFLIAVTCVVVVVIPAWVLTRGADLIFLAMAAVAYGLYVAGLVVLLRSGRDEERRRIREHWRVLLEPLLCLPYGAHLCRKLSERYRLTVPLVDILRSDTQLPVEDLYELSSHLEELRDVSETADNVSILDELKMLIDKRIAGYSQ